MLAQHALRHGFCEHALPRAGRTGEQERVGKPVQRAEQAPPSLFLPGKYHLTTERFNGLLDQNYNLFRRTGRVQYAYSVGVAQRPVQIGLTH